MHEVDAVHPPDGLAELAPHAPEEGFREASVLLIGVDHLEELAAGDVFEDEAVVGSAEVSGLESSSSDISRSTSLLVADSRAG